MASVSTNPATSSDEGQPSESVRSLVSFLIFVHLFALVIAVFSNEAPLQLEVALGRLPVLQQYRQVLGMDLPYTFYFTRGNDPGGELDIDYKLTATVKGADGATESIELPNADMWPHQRFHRYQQLAKQLAMYAAEDAPEPRYLELLTQAVAGGLLRAYDAQSVEIRCRGELTPPVMEEYQPEQDTRDKFKDAYDVRAFLADGQVELLKKEPARDTAPPPNRNESEIHHHGTARPPHNRTDGRTRRIARETNSANESGLVSTVGDYFRQLTEQFGQVWNRFWFTPSDPLVLSVMRRVNGPDRDLHGTHLHARPRVAAQPGRIARPR